jgi:type VI protein secretion system component Hcp
MSKLRRYHARYPQSKTDEYLRKHPDKQSDAVAAAEPGVVKMQHAIGNQAVQRLLQRDMQPEIQRAPGGDKKEEPSRPNMVATIVLGSGKVEGKSKLAGYEGKLEITSIQRGVNPAGDIEITFTRVSDELSAKLQEAAAKGIAVKTAQFEFLDYGDGEAKTKHTMDFADGHISYFQMSSHEGVPHEAITITFGPAKKKEDD